MERTERASDASGHEDRRSETRCPELARSGGGHATCGPVPASDPSEPTAPERAADAIAGLHASGLIHLAAGLAWLTRAAVRAARVENAIHRWRSHAGGLAPAGMFGAARFYVLTLMAGAPISGRPRSAPGRTLRRAIRQARRAAMALDVTRSPQPTSG